MLQKKSKEERRYFQKNYKVQNECLFRQLWWIQGYVFKLLFIMSLIKLSGCKYIH